MITIKSILTFLVTLGLSVGAALGVTEINSLANTSIAGQTQATIDQAVNKIDHYINVGAETAESLAAETAIDLSGEYAAMSEADVQTDGEVSGSVAVKTDAQAGAEASLTSGVGTFLQQVISTFDGLSAQAGGETSVEASVSATTVLPAASTDLGLGLKLTGGTNIRQEK